MGVDRAGERHAGTHKVHHATKDDGAAHGEEYSQFEVRANEHHAVRKEMHNSWALMHDINGSMQE